MRLCEAMRNGIGITGPAKQMFAGINPETKTVEAACALGAAHIGAGVVTVGDFGALVDVTAWDHQLGLGRIATLFTPIYFGQINSTLSDVIVCLNDSLDWDRRFIADFVEGVEEAERLKAEWAVQPAAQPALVTA